MSKYLINIDLEKGWLLTKNSGENVLLSTNFNIWINAISSLANFHKKRGNNTRPIPSFLQNFPLSIEPFLELVSNKIHMKYREINNEEAKKLNSHILEYKKIIIKINKNFPMQTIFHGDAHYNNVLVNKDEKITWFDWCEAHISHPLTDIGWNLWWIFPDRKNIKIGISVNDSVRQILFEHYTTSMGWKNFDLSILDIMKIGLVHRASLYHKQYRNIKKYVFNS